MKRRNRTASIPAPIGGINARDSLASQKPEDAVHLSNYWPGGYDVMVRKGYTVHATPAAPATRLMAHRQNTGADTLFYVSGSQIYNASDNTLAVGSMTDPDYSHVNFANSGGTYLFVVNGADTAKHFNGTTWATPAITGVTSDNFSHVTMHKDRLWFVVKDSLKAAYLPSKAIAGAATEFDFRSLCKEGGYLVAMATWTLDAGAGMDDHLVAITSEGECLVYQGTDPASASTWSLVGVWLLAKPVSRDCFCKMGGDVIYFGRQGPAVLSKALASSQISSGNTMSDRIKPLISQDWGLYGGNTGWCVALYPQESMLILNVPESATLSHQWVMNTITGAWTRFDAVNAMHWERFEDSMYFAQSDQVSKFWDGFTDLPGGVENTIRADALTSFQMFGGRSENKRFVLVRPNLVSGGFPSIWFEVNTDYNPSEPSYTPEFSADQTAATWGNFTWGNAKWAGGKYQLNDWQHGGAVGRAAALWLRMVSKGIETRWSATDYTFEMGGTL